MDGMNAIAGHSWLGRAWEVASDLLIVTAVVWALPLLLGVITAVVRILLHWVP
jgi:hypothetical protein